MSRILVDCDDVLIDLCLPWLNKLNQLYHTNYTVNDIKDWNMTGLFDVPKPELVKPLTKKEIWLKCKPIENSAFYLKKLQDEGHEIYIVTATDYRNFAIKVEHCIKKYFPFFPIENIICCNHKYMIQADYLIDDNIQNLTDGCYTRLLFTRSHNSRIDDDIIKQNGIIRVNDWEECYNIITNKRTG